MLNDENFSSMASRLYDLFAAGLLSVLGGTAAYTYKTVKEDTGFSLKHFFINAFLAFFIGNMLGNFLPPTAQYRDGMLMLAGFATWPILGIMEFYGRRIVVKWIDAKLNMNEAENALADQAKAEDKNISQSPAPAPVEPEAVVETSQPPQPAPAFVVGTADKTQRN
jgi:uncharacterized membrane protein